MFVAFTSRNHDLGIPNLYLLISIQGKYVFLIPAQRGVRSEGVAITASKPARLLQGIKEAFLADQVDSRAHAAPSSSKCEPDDRLAG